MNYGTSLAYVVQSDLILSELQHHVAQRFSSTLWICWSIQIHALFAHFEHLL